MHSCSEPVNLIEVGALATAVFALVATIWQAAITRQHNKLSVRPVLTLYRKEIDGLIELKNNGVGPALIQSLEIWKEGNEVTPDKMHELLPVEFEAPDILPGAALAAGSSVCLIKATTRLLADHIEPMESLRFRVVYRSIYGQQWVLE